MKPNRTKFLTVRVSARLHGQFQKKAERFGGTSDVLREMVEAFLDNRLTIQPNPKKENLYVSRIED